MEGSSLRLVLDTNVLLAGLVSKSSASQKIVDALTARTNRSTHQRAGDG